MAVALVALSPRAIVQIFPNVPNPLRAPGIDGAVFGAQVGWSDGGRELVEVIPFALPAGQVTVGGPTYALDAGGNVVESYETRAAPPAPRLLATSVMLSRLTDAELLGIEQATAAGVAGGSVQLARWLEGARARAQIDLDDPASVAAKAGLVALSLLTQERADVIFSPG